MLTLFALEYHTPLSIPEPSSILVVSVAINSLEHDSLVTYLGLMVARILLTLHSC